MASSSAEASQILSANYRDKFRAACSKSKDGESETNPSSATQIGPLRQLGSSRSIKKRYSKVVCDSEYPPPVKFFDVPFKLISEKPIRRKPYTLSGTKQDYMEEELQSWATASTRPL